MTPGLILVFSAGNAVHHVVPLVRGRVMLGRDSGGLLRFDDRVSRQHVEVTYDTGWRVVDLDSRNGTHVNGARVHGTLGVRNPVTLRIGHSVFLFVEDVEAHAAGIVERPGIVFGAATHAAWERARLALTARRGLLVIGDPGTGREHLVRAAHADTGGGPFVHVPCTLVAAGLSSYVEAARGGTLYLDGVDELQPPLQAELLAALAGSPKVRVASSSAHEPGTIPGWFDPAIAARVAEVQVSLPSLDSRLDEIPWILQAVLADGRPPLRPHPRLVEMCLVRPWVGNVHELADATRRAGDAARQAGARTSVRASDLAPVVGTGVVRV